MASKLAKVALGGFAVALVAGVASILIGLGGVPHSHSAGLRFPFVSPSLFAGACGDDNTQITRRMAWTGSDRVGIDLAADVNWSPNNGDQLVIRGPASEVNRVRISGNEISLDCASQQSGDLTITLPGRSFASYNLNGFGKLTLTGLNQPSLALDISGAGDVQATGVVPRTTLTVSGAATVNMDDLITQDLTADLSGASNLNANPQQSAHIDLSGAGLVHLRTRPKDYHADVSGFGRIEVPDQTADVE